MGTQAADIVAFNGEIAHARKLIVERKIKL
jgi:hypothetical protein